MAVEYDMGILCFQGCHECIYRINEMDDKAFALAVGVIPCIARSRGPQITEHDLHIIQESAFTRVAIGNVYMFRYGSRSH